MNETVWRLPQLNPQYNQPPIYPANNRITTGFFDRSNTAPKIQVSQTRLLVLIQLRNLWQIAQTRWGEPALSARSNRPPKMAIPIPQSNRPHNSPDYPPDPSVTTAVPSVHQPTGYPKRTDIPSALWATSIEYSPTGHRPLTSSSTPMAQSIPNHKNGSFAVPVHNHNGFAV